jgi:hypothetical protein
MGQIPYIYIYIYSLMEYLQLSDASSASLNLPGKIQVIDLRVDSTVDIVETLLTRNDSYCASTDIEIGERVKMPLP